MGQDLKALGASWAFFGSLFGMLVFEVVFKSALGTPGLDFGQILKDLGKDFGNGSIFPP